jgi:hypothetical protein
MSTVTYQVHTVHAGMERLLHDEHGPMGQAMARLCNRIVGTSQGFANVDTGLMRSRIEFTIEMRDGELCGIVAARTEYSLYVHEGTWFMDGNPFLTDAAAIEIQRGMG